MLSRLLVVLGLLATVQAFTTCTEQARSLRSDRINVALMRGILWPDQTINQTTPSNDFHLCMRIADGPYLRVQVDTGSTGIVVNKHSVGTIEPSTSEVCQSFLYDSSNNAYWGPMIRRSVTLFGGDTDGRYLRVGPIDDQSIDQGMPVMSVEYICKGANCLHLLNGDRPSTTDCAYIRDRLANNQTVNEHWHAITLDDPVAMLGVGYDRGAAAEGYTAPVPLSRNAALRINTSTLKSVTINQSINQSNSSFPCYSNINATQYSACSDLGACDQTQPSVYQYQCKADVADPAFAIGSIDQYYPIGYVITRKRFIPLISSPSTSIAHSVNPISQTSQFSCVTVPVLPVNTVDGQPGFNCFNANAVQAQNELRPFDQSISQLGQPIYAAHGNFLPDTGIEYEIFEPHPKPLIEQSLDQLITFRFPILPNRPADVNCSINQSSSNVSSCQSNTWSFVAHFGNETHVNNVSGYYPTSAYQSINQSPPTFVRFINNTAVPIPSNQSFNQSMFVNTGRFLMTDFMYYVNLQSGVIGFAPFADTDTLPDTVKETETNNTNKINSVISFIVTVLSVIALLID